MIAASSVDVDSQVVWLVFKSLDFPVVAAAIHARHPAHTASANSALRYHWRDLDRRSQAHSMPRPLSVSAIRRRPQPDFIVEK
jgi:hypothetical protein